MIDNNPDVICQFNSSGEIIPLRVRITENGEFHTFTIKGYRNISVNGAYTTPDGIYVNGNTLIFECMIDVLGQRKTIRLYFGKKSLKWSVAV
jgi:hypothetical protein